MRSTISHLAGILLLIANTLHGQDLSLTKRSSKYLTQEEVKNLIREAAYEAASRQKVPRVLFERQYPNVERQLWAEARTPIIQAFRWVDNADDIYLRGTRKEAYQQALSQAVYKVFVAQPGFKSLIAFDQTDRILSFKSDVAVNTDGWLTVTESITIYNGSGEQTNAYLELYPGERTVNNDIQRGLERTFPTDYVNDLGLLTEVPFEITAVQKNGQPENFILTSYGNGKLLRIGSPDEFLEEGIYEYTLVYKTRYQLKFHEGKTELYWNVNGNGWVFTADSVQCKISFPDGSEIFEQACYTGLQGSTEKNCTRKVVGNNSILFFSNQTLQSYEGLTVAAAIQPGVITPPSSVEMMVAMVRSNWQLSTMIVLIVLLFLINLFNWFRWGRDPKKGVRYPQFDPPAGISPADAGFIYHQKYKTEQFSAALIDLAVQKGISIQVKKEGSLFKKNTYTFKMGSAGTAIKNYTRTTYDWDIETLYNLKADGSYDSTFETLSSELALHLANKYQTDSAGKETKRGLFRRNAGAASWGFVALFFAAVFAVFALAPVATNTLIVVAAIVWGIGFLMQFVFYKIMPAFNQPGRQLLDALLGFRMYLATAEEKRFDKLNPPEKNLQLFERFLPYAVALGCQQAWANKFEDILKNAIANKSYQPAYYDGDMGENFSIASLSQSFSSGLSSTIASSSSAPSDSDSGGSSGGGSSGGGGGGGGGGGW